MVKKMSKSDISEYSRIMMTDSDDEISKNQKAKTDAKPLPDSKKDLEQMPEANNLLTIYSAFEDQNFDLVFDRYCVKTFLIF